MRKDVYGNLKYTVGEYILSTYGYYNVDSIIMFARKLDIEEKTMIQFMKGYMRINISTLLKLCEFFRPDHEIKDKWIEKYAEDHTKYSGTKQEIEDAIMLAVNNVMLSDQKKKYALVISYLQLAIMELEKESN